MKILTKKTKRILLGLILLINSLTLSVPLVYADGSATLALSPASGTFNKGCTVAVDINLDTGGVDTDGTDAILIFDPTRLRANNIVNGTIYPDYPGNNVDNTGGKVSVSGISSVTSAFNGSGKLATVNFTVLDTAPAGATQIKFDFDPTNKAKTTDSNVVAKTVSDVLNSVTDGSYIIGTGSCAQGAASLGTGSGSTVTGAATTLPTKVPPKQLADSATTGPTLFLIIGGGALTVLGIIGLALL